MQFSPVSRWVVLWLLLTCVIPATGAEQAIAFPPLYPDPNRFLKAILFHLGFNGYVKSVLTPKEWMEIAPMARDLFFQYLA
ncbi:MAG: hypothetical protein WA705_21820 [Candidatus Ozemobacteraceae bacterium]